MGASRPSWVRTEWQVSLPLQLANRLERLARRRGQPTEHLIQRAVDLFIQASDEGDVAPATVSALEARRAANRAVFGDLVGLAVSSGTPTWQATPKPRWRVPFHAFTGELLLVVEVDALTGVVRLTDKERIALLNRVETLVIESRELG